jgi:hypothetical protein
MSSLLDAAQQQQQSPMKVDPPLPHPIAGTHSGPQLMPPFADHTNKIVLYPTTTAATTAAAGTRKQLQRRAESPLRPASPTRSLAPLRSLERAHPYRRDPADERALRLLVFANANGHGWSTSHHAAAAAVHPFAHQAHEYGVVDRRLGIESY